MTRLRDQSGQTAAELTGLLLLVAAVIFLLTTVAAAKIPNRVSELVCQIAGGECTAQADQPRQSEPEETPERRPARQLGSAEVGEHAAGTPEERALTSSSGRQGDDICRYMRSLCELPGPSDLGVDLGDEELYDITFGRGVYVSIYENATGAILLLYELCGEDVECLVNELEERGIGPQEGTGAAQWNDALAPDQWDDLEEAIRDVREEGGCLNAHF